MQAADHDDWQGTPVDTVLLQGFMNGLHRGAAVQGHILQSAQLVLAYLLCSCIGVVFGNHKHHFVVLQRRDLQCSTRHQLTDLTCWIFM